MPGPNTAYQKSILDHLTLQRIEHLKPLASDLIGVPVSAGVVLRAAVEMLWEESQRWKNLDTLDEFSVKQRLLRAKTARPAQMTTDELRSLQNRG